MKRMIVLSAALILIGAHVLRKERWRRSALQEQKVQLQNWEDEGGRAEDADSQPVSSEST